MNTSLSPWLSRTLAVAILVALLGLIASWVVAPLLQGYQETQRASARYAAALARANPSGGSVAALRAELTRLQRTQTSAVGFLRSSNESLAAAELQSRLKSAVDAVRGDLRSTQTLQAQPDGAFRRIAIRGEVVTTLPALQRLIYQLETASPFLYLDNVDIRAYPMPVAQGAAKDPILDVRFDLAGYMRRVS